MSRAIEILDNPCGAIDAECWIRPTPGASEYRASARFDFVDKEPSRVYLFTEEDVEAVRAELVKLHAERSTLKAVA